MNKVTRKLLHWFEGQEQRDLPWKVGRNPYRIWLAEIMLQQTRVAQARPYYLSFINKFPDIRSLANANIDQVLKAWEGLGYYSRARNLHFSAQFISENHNGQFPSDYKSILSLKGIGTYTAAAISSFAFGKSYAAIDGNVLRVISRIYGIQEPIDTSATKKIIEEICTKLIKKADPAIFNQAIMDFGATHCTPKRPKCKSCPFFEDCQALLNNMVKRLPLKSKKIKLVDRNFHYLIVKHGATIYLDKRIEKDIWQDLYQFPLIQNWNKKEGWAKFEKLFQFKTMPMLKDKMTQKLTHQKINVSFYEVEIETLTQKNTFLAVKMDELRRFAFPKIVDLYITKHFMI